MLKSKGFMVIFIVAFILMSSIVSFGASISYTYDDLHRLKQIDHHSNETITVYSYDEVGNRTRKIVTSPSSPPVAEFTATSRSGTPPLTVNFTDQSVGNITSWSWNFGDGETSSLQNPSHIYQSLGNHTVSLTVDGPNGSNTHTKVNYIIVTNPPSCTYWISPTWQFYEASGGSDYVDVSASSSDCPWTATSNNPDWITITSGNNGTGNGEVYYSVAPNSDTNQRDGTITIADQTFSITQAAGGCVYSIIPSSKYFDVTGGTGSVSVAVADGCAWTATSNDSWITITSGGIGIGNGTVNYLVEETSDMNPRTGTITIAGKIFTINQNASVSGSSIQLPKTGQTKCYDLSGTEISCTGTGQDGEDQAGLAWPDPRFTVGTGSESECITDNLTGLMWARNGNLNGKRTWYEAIDYANNLTLCGYSDWHLSNANELESLINADEPNTAAWLNTQGFVDVQSANYWSSTTYYTPADTNNAWAVHMNNGQMAQGGKSGDYNYLLLVRGMSNPDYPARIWQTGQKTGYVAGDDGDLQIGVAWPNPMFVDNGNGTVTDKLTNLIWLKDANCIKTMYPSFDNDWTSGDGAVSWQHAFDFVNGINDGILSNCSAGYNDWRLPNRKELRSLVDYSNLDPALPSDHPFTNVQSGYYWSSTTVAGSASYAWIVSMLNIDIASGGKEEIALFVWPVRTMLLDTVPPTLNITSHSDGQHVTTSSITLAGTASDSGQGDNGIQQVTINGSRANNDTATGNEIANWSKPVSLNAGSNTIAVIAYDNNTNHNQTSQSITIYYDQQGVPVIDKILGVKKPGLIVRIIGTNFGEIQGDSIVHIGPKTFNSSSPRIKLWSDTKIRIKLPNYKCEWFQGKDFRYRKVWVTVDGVDSIKKRIKVIKPDTCP